MLRIDGPIPQNGSTNGRSIFFMADLYLLSQCIRQPLQPAGRINKTTTGIDLLRSSYSFLYRFCYLQQCVINTLYYSPHKMGLCMTGMHTQKNALSGCIPYRRTLTL